jgi:glucose/arabinose dehydrogenase
VALLALAASARAQVPPGTYKIETLRGPPGVAFEVSGLAFAPDGELLATFRRGYVYGLDPTTGRWRRFASGLKNPLGLLAPAAGEVIVAQPPELTRVVDTDKDGVADLYETLADGWGLSGNYHEYVGNPVRDAQGNLYLGLGLASGVANPRPPLRGRFVEAGRQAKAEAEGKVNRVGHYAPVPYRGCIVKVTPAGQLTPFACGLRQSNGLVVSPDGALFAADNQGDWVGTSPLHHVTEGAFHGHPASLNWHPRWKGGDPVEARVDELARWRKPPAIQFPQNDMAGSVAQPIFDLSNGKLGPYTGQLIVAEWTNPRLLRADLEQVEGVWQGAGFILLEGQGLRPSNMRLALAPDGSALYVGQTSRIWGSVEGLQRVTFTGQTPFDVLHMRLGPAGFELELTRSAEPATARDPAAWAFTRYRYLYHAQYGSPKTDVTPVPVTEVKISPDGRRVSLRLAELHAGWIYELRPRNVRAADGAPLCTRLAAYTLNRLQSPR